MACPRGCCKSYREHLLSISIAPSAMPSKMDQTSRDTFAREKRWDRDMPAYAELRRQGTQPERVEGAAVLASRAEDKTFIETAGRFNEKDLSRAEDWAGKKLI